MSAIQLLETILDGIISGAVIFSPENRPIYANKSFLSLFGYSTFQDLANDIFGSEFPETYDEQENRIDLKEFLSKRKETAKVKPIVFHCIPKYTTNQHWIRLQHISFPGERIDEIYSLWIANDLTELRTEQKQLQTDREMLELKVQERTAAILLLNKELTEQVADRMEAARFSDDLIRIGTKIIVMSDSLSILQAICDETIKSIGYDFCSIFLFNEETDSLELTAYSPKVELPFQYPPLSKQKYEEYFQVYGSPVIIPDIRFVSDEPGLEMMKLFGIRTLLFFPMKNDGDLIGSLGVASVGDCHLPSQNELNFLHYLIPEIEVSVSKGHLIEKLTESTNRMQYLSNKLVQVQEEERRNLARELHDQIGQSLSSLRMNLDLLTKTILSNPERHDAILGYIENAKETTVRLLERVREISLDLRPSMLDDFGLVPALLAFFERQAAQADIQVEFKHSGVEGRYSYDLETAVFRIIQEGYTNAAKYSGEKLIHIRLWADDQLMRLQVEDSGNGFDLTKALNSGKTSGLSGMYERVESLDGSLEIETEPMHGTCLTAELPIKMGEESQ